MVDLNEHTITAEVLRRTGPQAAPRTRALLDALVRHLHDFARETRLTEAEWVAAIDFLTRTGATCDDERQEFILLSDVLGLSMLVTAQNNRRPDGCTEATVLGPFFVAAAPVLPLGSDVSQGAKGTPCWVSGRVRSPTGEPIGGARIDVWQADEDGFYDVQYSEREQLAARATLRSDGDGGYRFWSIVAEAYPIPHDGPVGDLLERLGRHPWRPAHLHFRIEAPGWQPLTTHVFRRGDRWLDSDAVFGVRTTLVADWVRHDAGPAPDGSVSSTPFHTLDFDFVLAAA